MSPDQYQYIFHLIHFIQPIKRKIHQVEKILLVKNK